MRKHWLNIVIVMIIILFVMYVIGYFANGIFGATFDIGSIWIGVGSITSISLAGIGNYAISTFKNRGESNDKN